MTAKSPQKILQINDHSFARFASVARKHAKIYYGSLISQMWTPPAVLLLEEVQGSWNLLAPWQRTSLLPLFSKLSRSLNSQNETHRCITVFCALVFITLDIAHSSCSTCAFTCVEALWATRSFRRECALLPEPMTFVPNTRFSNALLPCASVVQDVLQSRV